MSCAASTAPDVGTKSADEKAWRGLLAAAAKDAGLRGGAWWFPVVDGELLTVGIATMSSERPDAEGKRIGMLSFSAKPLELDPLLWRTLFPGSDMGGPAKQLSLRCIGAFALHGLRLGRADQRVSADAPDPEAGRAAIEELLEAARRFVTETPDTKAFLRRVEEQRAARPEIPHLLRLEEALARAAIGDREGVSRLVDEALAAGEVTYANEGRSIWQRLRADLDAGTGIFA